jgi:hypothetical protein
MADEQIITAKFIADTSGFTTGAEEVIASSKAIEASTSGISQATQKAGESLSSMGGSAEKAAQGAQAAVSSFSAVGKATEEMSSGTKSAASSFAAAGQSLQITDQMADKAVAEFLGVGQASEKAGEGAKSAGGGFGLMGIAMNAMMAIQFAQMVGQVVAALAQAHDAAQATERAFTTLMHSEMNARQELALLANTSAAADFGAQKVQNAAQYFLMLGKDADTTNKEIIKVSDALAAAGASGDHLIPAINDLHNLQKEAIVTHDSIDQLAKDGVPAWDALAAGMTNARGRLITVAEAQKEVDAGAIHGADAYKYMMNGMVEYTGKAEQSSQSLGSEWTRLGENATRAFGPVIEALTKILDGINKILESSASLGDVIRLIVQASAFVVTGGGQIPGYAEGIIDSPVGHFGMVGERGPELMYIPQGASIFSNGANPFAGGAGSSGGGQSMPSLSSMAGSSESNIVINITHLIQLDSRTIAQQTIPHIAPIVRQQFNRRS